MRDLPAAAAPLRRLGGWLWVFTDVEFESPDTSYGVWAGRCTRVIQAPPGTRLRRASRPRRTMRLRPASLRFRVETDIPDVAFDSGRLAPPLRDVRIPDVRQEAWWTMRFGLQEGARRDFRDPVWGIEHRLLGYLNSPNGESGRCWERTQRRSQAWRHLLSIGYDDRIGFEVADAGMLQVAIAPRDLRRGNFDRVCGIFDSA